MLPLTVAGLSGSLKVALGLAVTATPLAPSVGLRVVMVGGVVSGGGGAAAPGGPADGRIEQGVAGGGEAGGGGIPT